MRIFWEGKGALCSTKRAKRREAVCLPNQGVVNISAYYRPEIDGLRAIAILTVVLYHTDLGCSGGYVGVDIFFVISGYLITQLLVREASTGSISLVKFWERRIRRLMPALLVVTTCTAGAGWLFLLPKDLAELARSFVAQSCLVSNVFFWKSIGYFKGEAEIKPLLHTWSLAVEEQFYIFFPVSLMLIYRFRRSLLRPFMVVFFVASFLLSIYGIAKFRSATFYLVPTRAWELLFGAAGAVWNPLQSISQRQREALCWMGAALIAFSVFFFSNVTPFPGPNALVPCLGAYLIINCNTASPTVLGRYLSHPIPVGIGLISYSLYLWHWPLLAFAKYLIIGKLGVEIRFGLFILSFVAGYLSYRFVERPFRERFLASRTKAYVFALVTTAWIVGLGLYLRSDNGHPSRFPDQALDYATAGRITEVSPPSLQDTRDGKLHQFGSQDPRSESVLLWGDSFAMAALPAFEILAEKHHFRGYTAAWGGTPPLLDFSETGEAGLHEQAPIYAEALLKHIRKSGPSQVVLVSRWSAYNQQRVPECLHKTVKAIQDCGARVWIVKEVPQQSFDVPRALALTVVRGGNCSQLGVSQAEHVSRTKVFSATADNLASEGMVKLIDPSTSMIENGICKVERSGISLYSDSYHLSAPAARDMNGLFEPVFLP